MFQGVWYFARMRFQENLYIQAFQAFLWKLEMYINFHMDVLAGDTHAANVREIHSVWNQGRIEGFFSLDFYDEIKFTFRKIKFIDFMWIEWTEKDYFHKVDVSCRLVFISWVLESKNTRMGNSDEWKEFGGEYRSERRRKYKTLSPKAQKYLLDSIRLENKKVLDFVLEYKKKE